MNAKEIYEALQSHGVQLKLSQDGMRVLVPKSATPEQVTLVKTNRDSVLMYLHHLVGGDVYDPRLAFLISGGENGLSRGAIETRMVIGLGCPKEVARVLVTTAMAEGFLVATDGLVEILTPSGRTASGFEFKREKVTA